MEQLTRLENNKFQFNIVNTNQIINCVSNFQFTTENIRVTCDILFPNRSPIIQKLDYISTQYIGKQYSGYTIENDKKKIIFQIIVPDELAVGIYWFQFWIETKSKKYYVTTVPTLILNNNLTILDLMKHKIDLICLVEKKIDDKKLKSLLNLIYPSTEYINNFFQSNPFARRYDDLREVLYWYSKCCMTFEKNKLLFDKKFIPGYLSTQDVMFIINKMNCGLLYISASGDLTLSYRAPDSKIRDIINNPLDFLDAYSDLIKYIYETNLKDKIPVADFKK